MPDEELGHADASTSAPPLRSKLSDAIASVSDSAGDDHAAARQSINTNGQTRKDLDEGAFLKQGSDASTLHTGNPDAQTATGQQSSNHAISQEHGHPEAGQAAPAARSAPLQDSPDASQTVSEAQSKAQSGAKRSAPLPNETLASEAAVPVKGPYRRRASRSAKPKGILKPAPPPPTKFNFRRDVLSYVVGDAATHASSSIGPSSSHVNSASHASAADTSSTHSIFQPGTSPASTSTTPPSSLPATVPPPAATASSRALGGGGLWRRLGGAVTAVAANVPVPQAAVKTIGQLAGSTRGSRMASTGGPDLNTRGPASPSADRSSPVKAAADSETVSAEKKAKAESSLGADYVKSVRFTMSTLAVVYPINGPGPPGTEAATRKRINREYRQRQEEQLKKGGWTNGDLLALYDDCCRTREEPGIPQLRRLLMSTSTPPKTIDLSNVALSQGSAEVLSDVLSVDFGLRKLLLDGCSLDDDSIKPIIHALIVSSTLPHLSVANNKRIRSKGWRVIAHYMRRSAVLKYLDASDNVLDRKMIDYIGQAVSITPSPKMTGVSDATDFSTTSAASANGSVETPRENETSSEDELEDLYQRAWRGPQGPRSKSPGDRTQSAVTSLRMEGCALRNNVLEALAHHVRHSTVKHISLRKNRINQVGAVALAVMIRDYEPPQGSTEGSSSNLLYNISSAATGQNTPPDTRAVNGSHREPEAHHTPYMTHIPGRNSVTARSVRSPDSATHSPVISHMMDMPTSVTSPPPTEVDDNDGDSVFGPERNRGRVSIPEREANRYADLRLRLQRQIENLPRIGTLLTLDVRSNDIRTGITYIAQVLKRNRTLRVLNLSDNKIDSASLGSLSEALKYNTTLETLDLSNNPCCGPTLDGLQSLRSALVLNSTLMRLFLNNTGLTTSAAIALAEYLPDMPSLIHLDLTDNPDLDIAGIMALSASIKLNRFLRCLDLSIPPNNPEFARLSQDILQSCIRNTEHAQKVSLARGTKGSISTPIYKSEIVRDLRDLEEHTLASLQLSNAAVAELSPWSRAMLQSAKNVIGVMTASIQQDEGLQREGKELVNSASVLAIYDEATALQLQLLAREESVADLDRQNILIPLSSHLAVLLQRASNLYGLAGASRPGKQELGNKLSTSLPSLSTGEHLSPIKPPLSPTAQLPSPSFSITDSDDDTQSSHSSSTSESSRPEHAPLADSAHDDIFGASSLAQAPSQKRGKAEQVALEVPASSLHDSLSSSAPRSPVENHSRTLTLEEGEVFRRGISKVQGRDETLLDVLDQDIEADGEELKQELLEVEVERPRRASISSGDELEAQDEGAGHPSGT